MSEVTIEKMLLLTLGWLLGVLGPIVTDAIKKSRENRQVKVALAAELLEVSYKLALANYSVNIHFGTVDRPYLHWLQGVTSNYRGPSLTETIQPLIKVQLGLPEAQLVALVREQTAKNGKNIVTQKFIVPLLDARVSSLWYLTNKVQILLLDIRSNINLLNELVDQARYYNGLTFGKLEGDNYILALGNLNGCHRQYAERAKVIVTKIEELGSLL
jgi:hypothetical protein